MWKHVPITALATTWAFSFGVDYGWMQKIVSNGLEDTGSEYFRPWRRRWSIYSWPCGHHARKASSKEYGRLAPVNSPLCCSYWWPMHRAATRLMPISDWRMLIKCGSWLKVFGGSYLASAVWLVSRGEAARSFLLADFEGEMLGFLGGTKCFSVKKCGFSIMRNPINRFKVLGLTCFILLLFRFSFHANRYCGELSTAAVLATPVPWVIDLKIIRKG